MNRRLKIAGFVTLLVAIGLMREHFFVNMNYLLHYKFYSLAVDPLAVSEVYGFLQDFSYQTLYFSKWLATLGFVVLFWFIQKKFLLFLFDEKKPVFWLGMLYLSLLLLAGISFAAGWAIGHLDEGYRFSRIFMGLLQSPAPCMLLIPLTYFYRKQTP